MRYLLLCLLFSLSLASFSQKMREEKVKFIDNRLPLKPVKTIKSYDFTVSTPYPENNNNAVEMAKKQYETALANYPNVVAESERLYKESLVEYEESVELAKEKFRIEEEAFSKKSALERIALSDQAPKLYLPSKPKYYKPAAPVYVEPNTSNIIIFDSKMLASLYLKLHGFEKGNNNALNGKITVYYYESTEPEAKTKEVSTYDKNSGKSITRIERYYVMSYRRTVFVDLEHNGAVLYSGMVESSKEYKKIEASSLPSKQTLEKRSVEEALVMANEFINDNYGYTPQEFTVEVSYVKNKSEEYDDVEKAKDLAVSGYNSFKSGVKNDDLEKAISLWTDILKESDLTDKKARIDEKVTRTLLINIIEAAITINDFKIAEANLDSLKALDSSSSEKKLIEKLEIRFADKKLRFDASI